MLFHLSSINRDSQEFEMQQKLRFSISPLISGSSSVRLFLRLSAYQRFSSSNTRFEFLRDAKWIIFIIAYCVVGKVFTYVRIKSTSELNASKFHVLPLHAAKIWPFHLFACLVPEHVLELTAHIEVFLHFLQLLLSCNLAFGVDKLNILLYSSFKVVSSIHVNPGVKLWWAITFIKIATRR